MSEALCRHGRVAVVVCCAFVTTAGCERKAPGPTECRLLAYRLVGVSERELLQVPEVRRRVDEVTMKCLTTPFDRELVRCVERRGQARACTLEYELRRRQLREGF
ncbi:MAG TPA: hypothetical protein VER33_23720 [Polyangiaceae bacterium]|nr:hypothetical protein [Polyangiaceae bacterium]